MGGGSPDACGTSKRYGDFLPQASSCAQMGRHDGQPVVGGYLGFHRARSDSTAQPPRKQLGTFRVWKACLHQLAAHNCLEPAGTLDSLDGMESHSMNL